MLDILYTLHPTTTSPTSTSIFTNRFPTCAWQDLSSSVKLSTTGTAIPLTPTFNHLLSRLLASTPITLALLTTLSLAADSHSPPLANTATSARLAHRTLTALDSHPSAHTIWEADLSRLRTFGACFADARRGADSLPLDESARRELDRQAVFVARLVCEAEHIDRARTPFFERMKRGAVATLIAVQGGTRLTGPGDDEFWSEGSTTKPT